MPLVLAPVGREMKVVKIVVDDATKTHLEDLGIIVGRAITLLSTDGGVIMCLTEDDRLALDEDLASHIYVV